MACHQALRRVLFRDGAPQRRPLRIFGAADGQEAEMWGCGTKIQKILEISGDIMGILWYIHQTGI
jgi:hypothetical protein